MMTREKYTHMYDVDGSQSGAILAEPEVESRKADKLCCENRICHNNRQCDSILYVAKQTMKMKESKEEDLKMIV